MLTRQATQEELLLPAGLDAVASTLAASLRRSERFARLGQGGGFPVKPVHPSLFPAGQASNVLGKFRLIAELGRGGMSEVYLAVIAGPAGFNKLVVVKLIKAELAEDPEFISMFLEEARLAARLNHPNVVQTNEVGEIAGRYYIAMEYLEGQPYSRVIHRLGRDSGLPIGMSLRILCDVLGGLHYAHELPDFDGAPLGVVHRDVTPHNIFLTYDGQVKVVDFGIAKAMNSANETRTGMLKGKVGYMAPEQARGERVDRRADVFSVGVMLWEAAVGRRLWKGLNEVQMLHQMIHGEIPSPRTQRPDISTNLESIIMRALSMDREQRQATCADLALELEELLDASSERTTLREVGRRVARHFEDERAKLRQIIEGQLARSATMNTAAYAAADLPNLEPAPLSLEVPIAQVNAPLTAHGHVGLGGPQAGLQTGPHAAHLAQSGPNGDLSFSSSQQAFAFSPMGVPAIGGHLSGSYPGGNTPSNPQSHPHSHPHSNPQRSSVPSFQGRAPTGPHDPSSVQRPATEAVPPGAPSGPVHFQNVPAVHNNSMPPSGSYSQPQTGSIARANMAAPTLTEAHHGETASRRLMAAALVIAALAGGLVALLYLQIGRDRAPGPTPATTAAPTATPLPDDKTPPTATTPTSSPTDGATLVLRVAISPAGATLTLDGEPVTMQRDGVRIPRDGKTHTLRAEASGYTPREREFVAGDDFTWDVELSRAQKGARLPPPKSSAEKTPPDPKDPMDTGKMRVTPTSRPIDVVY